MRCRNRCLPSGRGSSEYDPSPSNGLVLEAACVCVCVCVCVCIWVCVCVCEYLNSFLNYDSSTNHIPSIHPFHDTGTDNFMGCFGTTSWDVLGQLGLCWF